MLLRSVVQQRHLSFRSNPSSLWNRYFNIPKGFRKHFDRNPNKKNGDKGGDKGKGDGPKGNNNKGDNDNGGDDDEMIMRILKASGLLVLGFVGMSLYDDFSKGCDLSTILF